MTIRFSIADSIYDWIRSARYRANGAYLNVGEHANITQRQRPVIKSIGYNISILSIFILSLWDTTNVFAAAWTQSAGSTQIITSFSNYNISSSYNINGERTELDNIFRKYEINPFIEHGLTSDITIGANPLLQYWQVIKGTQRTSGHIFESEFFLRKKLLTIGNGVVSVQPLVKTPCIDISGPAWLTCDSYDIELRLLAGYGFKMDKKLSNSKMRPFSGQYHFLNIETAYRMHTDNSSDVIKIDGTAGFRYNENILLMGQIFSTIATGKENVSTAQHLVDRYANLKLQLSSVIQTSTTTSLQLGIYEGLFSEVAENNFKTYNGVILGVWKRF